MKNITLKISDKLIKKIIKANIKTGTKSEWCGIIFYKKISNTVLEAVDMCFMGKGPDNSMVVSIDYAKYPDLSLVLGNYVMANAEELVDCYQGLIHSHIEMDTSPSSVDYQELMVNNPNYNGTYLSVICNHKLKFTSLISLEEEEYDKEYTYKWFGQTIKEIRKGSKTINIYKINTELDIPDYEDIDDAIKITTVVEKPSYVNQFNMFGNNKPNYLTELNNYFGFSNRILYHDKIETLNTYDFYEYSVEEFLEELNPNINEVELFKDLYIYKDTQFVTDLKAKFSSKNKTYEFKQKI